MVRKLFQTFKENIPTSNPNNELMLIKTDPLYIRTVFAMVSDKYLPKGHTSYIDRDPKGRFI